MATTLGWFLGGLIFTGLSFVTSGIAIGLLQWLVLQQRIHHPWRWVIASAAGWFLGYLIVILGIPLEFDILNGFVLGLATGTAQWLLLRKEVLWAGWWIIFSAIGWTTGLTLLPGILLTGTMAGALTGIALEVLLRSPKPKTIKDTGSA